MDSKGGSASGPKTGASPFPLFMTLHVSTRILGQNVLIGRELRSTAAALRARPGYARREAVPRRAAEHRTAGGARQGAGGTVHAGPEPAPPDAGPISAA